MRQVESQPVVESKSEQLEELLKESVQAETEKRMANDSIISIADDVENMKKSSNRNFIITLIISVLSLIVAIFALFK